MASWGRIGEVLGTGLGETLGGLAKNKAQKLQERQSVQRWQNLGVDPQKAGALAALSPQLQQQAFAEILPALELLQQQGQKGATQQMPGNPAQPMQQNPAINSNQVTQKPNIFGPMTASQRKAALEQQKLQQKQKVEDTKQQHHADKETSKFYKETLLGAKSADNNDRRLKRMETLVEKGNLTNPTFHSLLNTLEKGVFGFGINLHSLENPNSQEFNKISKEFLKDAKETFGNRLTNLDVETFLKMVPDLSQSDDGKKRIINNMKAYNQASRIRKQAMDDIIKENGGKRPLNLESLVEEKAGQQLDQLAQEFKEGYGAENKEVAANSAGVLDQIRKLLHLDLA